MKKLIESPLPLEAINAEAARQKRPRCPSRPKEHAKSSNNEVGAVSGGLQSSSQRVS